MHTVPSQAIAGSDVHHRTPSTHLKYYLLRFIS
jgi:hypothetical protein